jgi:hypothetical protein
MKLFGGLGKTKRARATAVATGALATLALVSLATAATTTGLLLAGDFEKGIVDSALMKVSGNAPVITTEVKRSGKYAIKSVLNRATSATSYRTEFAVASQKLTQGGEYWYGFSIYLPNDFAADPIWEIVAQWHSRPDSDAEATLNPPMSLHTENGIWRVNTIWDTNKTTVRETYTGQVSYKLGPYQKGKWTDWVFHVKWTPTSSGVLQVWQDGKKVVDKSGPIGFNDAYAPYFKFGMYKGWKDRKSPAGVVSTRTVFHDEIRVAEGANKYAEVAPGGGGVTIRPAAPVAVSLQ